LLEKKGEVKPPLHSAAHQRRDKKKNENGGEKEDRLARLLPFTCQQRKRESPSFCTGRKLILGGKAEFFLGGEKGRGVDRSLSVTALPKGRDFSGGGR